MGRATSVPDKPGKTAVEMFQAAADGEIKALWIACTNPAQSMPDQATVRRALAAREFVVVQEAFSTTATCDFADLLLPATTWGEKNGTVTNSERRICRVRPAVPAPGETRDDWAIAVDFARRLERSCGSDARDTLFPYRRRAEARLERAPRIHARPRPRHHRHELRAARSARRSNGRCAKARPNGTRAPLRRRRVRHAGRPRALRRRRLQAGGRSRATRAIPFSLNTGRLRDQWHGMSRTGTLGRLFGHVAEPTVQMHPQDMARRRLKEGDLVHVTSRRGSIVLPVAGQQPKSA